MIEVKSKPKNRAGTESGKKGKTPTQSELIIKLVDT